MAKATVVRSETPLQDLRDRLLLMMKINANSLMNGNLDHDERITVEAQNNLLVGIEVLVNQLIKKGRIWKGGYLDNVGVVYEDQLQSVLEQQEASQINRQLDIELNNLIDND